MSRKNQGMDIVNGNNVTLHDTEYLPACDASTCDDVVHFKGQYSSFGLIAANQALDVEKSFTWMAWVNPDAFVDAPLFHWSTHTGHKHGPHIWLHPDGKLFFRAQHGRTNLWQGSRKSNAKYTLNQWNKLAVTFIYSSGETGFYVNGAVEWVHDAERVQQLQPTAGDIYMGNRYVWIIPAAKQRHIPPKLGQIGNLAFSE